MLNSSWKKQLSENLSLPARTNKPGLAIVGVGSELNGDDGIGIHIARRLKRRLSDRKDTLVLEGGTLPENITSPLRRFGPGLVIIIDAADFSGTTGEIRFIPPEKIGGMSFSSHTLPLSMLARFLEEELDSKVLILGIQPESLEFGDKISPACRNAAERIVREFSRVIGPV